MLLKKLYDEYAELQVQLDLLRADKQQALDSILTRGQRAMMVEIEAEFEDPLQVGQSHLEAATKSLKDAVVESGATHNGEVYQVVFIKGRVKWDDKKLQDMVFDYPQLATARSVGNSYAVIRVRKTR